MKLIKLSDNKIYDLDSGFLYSSYHEEILIESTVENSRSGLKGWVMQGKPAANLWSYLDENASDETWRTA